VIKVIRVFVWIPRGTQAYVFVYDQVNTLDATFTKKVLEHFINQPTISADQFTVLRTENAASKGLPGSWPGGYMLSSLANANSACGGPPNQCYQYAGRLIGEMITLPDYAGAPSIVAVGGPGHEFDDGTGTNQNECQKTTQCADATDSQGLGNSATCHDPNAPNIMCPTSATAPIEAGAWRIEMQPNGSGGQKNDRFATLHLAQSTADTTAITTLPTASIGGATNYIFTWKDGTIAVPDTCTYTLTLPLIGIGGTLIATGTGCANTI
jgi:hypothetical protein